MLIIVALREEQQPFKSLLNLKEQPQPIHHWQGTLQTLTGKPRSVCLVAQNEMGGIEAAALTTRAICLLGPQAVAMTGIMGGFESAHLGLGDVVITVQSFDYAFGKVSENNPGKRAKNGKDRLDVH